MGSNAGSFLLAGPGWNGEKPDGVKAMIRSETEIGWVQFRMQLFNPAEIDGMKKVQAGYKVQPLSRFLGKPAPAAAPTLEFVQPLTPERQRTSIEFFSVLNFVLQFCPTHPSEKNLMARFAKLGIGAGGAFDAAKLSLAIKKAVEEGMADAWKEFAEFKKAQIDTGKRTAAEGFGTREFLKNDYLSRMASAVLGIYSNSKEEALYPAYYVDSDGGKLDASRNRYTLRFAADQLPPVRAFWSLTLYELPASLLVANPLNRYLISLPMLPDLKRDADGGLTLYLQHESPGQEKESNWLPAPKGEFWVVLRLYWPKEEALNGKWKAPLLQRVKADTPAGVLITPDYFVRAESDLYLIAVVKRRGIGTFDHTRVPTPIDDQTIIRMNRDTLYSAVVFDLDAGPATVTLPNPGGRFLSMQVINQDHYTPLVAYGGGKHTLSKEAMGTRYVVAAIRILVDPGNPKEVDEVIKLQDAIKVEQKNAGRFEVPNWDQASQKKVLDALIVLGSPLPDTRRMFGTKNEVEPVRHLIGSAMAWGRNPDKDAICLNITPKENDSQTVHRLTVKDVPVDGFWSISVYNVKGYFEPNKENAYTVNNLTAKKNDDGSVAVQFGGYDGKTANCLPVPLRGNYMVRLYRPRKEILDGTWTFPEAQPVT